MRQVFILVELMAVTVLLSMALHAEPEAFKEIFGKDKKVKGALVVMLPPKQIAPLLQKLQIAASEDPEWFRDHKKKTPLGRALLYDKKLGLTPKEYKEYAELWKARKFKEIGPVNLHLEENSNGNWVIRASGSASHISLLQYHPKGDYFQSPNGALVRIDNIDAPEDSPLGAWKGKEWKFFEESSFSITKENIAIGIQAGGEYALIVYRLQEVSASGRRLYDKSSIVRFPISKK